MARAYRTPGQPYFADRSLLSPIEASLRQVPSFYGPKAQSPGNWWYWLLGTPLDLGPALVLVGDDLDPAVRASCLSVLAARIGPTPWSHPAGPVLTGDNLVGSAFTHLSLGLLMNDAAQLDQVRDAIASVCVIDDEGEGIQSDASFHQHGRQLYTGGYGGDFASDVASYLLISRDTSFAIPTASVAVFADYLADGVAWALYGRFFDVSAVGRSVVRPTTSGFHGLAALLKMSRVASPRQSEIAAAAASMLRARKSALPLELAAIATDTPLADAGSASIAGHRHYPQSDYTIHRRAGYFASIKMLSDRTLSGELINGENQLGSRQSDGRLYLALDGEEYFGRAVWPALDWARLPGITVEQRPGVADATYGRGTRAFVGGTGDGRNGVSAMDFAPADSTLTAKKGWFFFNDAIVFTASGVSCESRFPVETIVQQWPLSRADAPLVVDGAAKPQANGWTETMKRVTWAVSDGVGYFFPTPSDVVGRREIRSGAWARIGGPAATPDASSPILSLLIDHGVAPQKDRIAYVIVPNTEPVAMAEWAAQKPIAVVANDERTTAVRDRRTSELGVIFWSAGSVAGIVSDTPAVLFLTPTSFGYELSVSDPAGAEGLMRITVPWHLVLRTPFALGVGVEHNAESTTITLPRSQSTTALSLSFAVKSRSARH